MRVSVRAKSLILCFRMWRVIWCIFKGSSSPLTFQNPALRMRGCLALSGDLLAVLVLPVLGGVDAVVLRL